MLCCRAPPALVLHLRRSRVQASARLSQARGRSNSAFSPGRALTRSPQVCMAQSSGVVKTYKLDASSEGCTGLFYRKRNAPGSFSTDGDKNWPRNGWTFKGVEAEPGWVQVVDAPDKWLPVSGHGHTYLWEQK